MPGSAQSRPQRSAHSDSSRPFVVGADLLDDPFVRTPEPQAEQHLQPGDTHQATDHISALPKNGKINDLASPFTRALESPIERLRNPGGFRYTPASTPDRSEQVQKPFVLGLDTIRHPFSDTPIVPDEPWSASTTLFPHPLTTMERADTSQGEGFGMPGPGVDTDKQPCFTPSAPTSSKETGAPNGQSAAQSKKLAPVSSAAGRLQIRNKKPQRVDLEHRPKAIEGPVGSLPDRGSSERSHPGSDKGEAEPKFPEQVYNVLLVGAAGVGQTSMIQYAAFTIPGDGKMLTVR